jgi:hypothetical protein
MPRLSPGEIADLRRQLVLWQTPEAMLKLYDDTVERIGSENLFTQAGLVFLRDAWIAATFARARSVKHVRLVADIWPDFEMKKAGRIEAFEAVEADDPQRRRGDEYRNTTKKREHDPIENWIARAELIPTWIAAACQKKANKGYGACAGLVVYLNPDEWGIRQEEVESSFPSATATVKDKFDTVWVLWKNQAHLVWQTGEVQSRGRR